MKTNRRPKKGKKIMKQFAPIEQSGVRVLLTSQLAEEYETDAQMIVNNFNRNKERYIEGKHYFVLEGEALQEFKGSHQFDLNLKYSPKAYLWTERGALLHAKSLNTDKAWEMYEILTENYFRVREQLELIKPLKQASELPNGIARLISVSREIMQAAGKNEFDVHSMMQDVYRSFGLPMSERFYKPAQNPQFSLWETQTLID